MGYDHGDSFPFDFEPNGIPFGSKSKRKLSPWSYLKKMEIYFCECSKLTRMPHSCAMWINIQFSYGLIQSERYNRWLNVIRALPVQSRGEGGLMNLHSANETALPGIISPLSKQSISTLLFLPPLFFLKVSKFLEYTRILTKIPSLIIISQKIKIGKLIFHSF